MTEWSVTFEGEVTVEAEDEENLRQIVQNLLGYTGVIVMDILDAEREGDE